MSESGWMFVQMLLEEAVRVLAPVVMAAVLGWLAYAIKRLRLQAGETRWTAIVEGVRYAIYAAEQSGMAGAIANEGVAKKNLAILLAQEFLSEQGVNVDVERLAALIESEVGQSLNWKRIDQIRSAD